jgi:hypothetical protein
MLKLSLFQKSFVIPKAEKRKAEEPLAPLLPPPQQPQRSVVAATTAESSISRQFAVQSADSKVSVGDGSDN